MGPDRLNFGVFMAPFHRLGENPTWSLHRDLELIEYLDPRGRPSRPETNDPGATHISLRVSDVDATYERLREAGVSVRSEPVKITVPGAWQGARCFYASDPDGVTVELIQTASPARE